MLLVCITNKDQFCFPIVRAVSFERWKSCWHYIIVVCRARARRVSESIIEILILSFSIIACERKWTVNIDGCISLGHRSSRYVKAALFVRLVMGDTSFVCPCEQIQLARKVIVVDESPRKKRLVTHSDAVFDRSTRNEITESRWQRNARDKCVHRIKITYIWYWIDRSIEHYGEQMRVARGIFSLAWQ